MGQSVWVGGHVAIDPTFTQKTRVHLLAVDSSPTNLNQVFPLAGPAQTVTLTIIITAVHKHDLCATLTAPTAYVMQAFL